MGCVNPGSPHTSTGAYDTMFIAVSTDKTAAGKVVHTSTLSRFQFLEGLLRMAVAKYMAEQV